MRKISLFIATLLLLAANSIITASAATASISYVSLKEDDANARTASLSGGSILYIRGENLPQDASQIEIYVGGLLCPTDNAATKEGQIGCKIPTPSSSGQKAVSVQANGEPAQVPSNIKFITFSAAATPLLHHLAPTAVTQGTSIKVGGQFRVGTTDLVDVIFTQLGLTSPSYCEFSTSQTISSSNDLTFVTCNVNDMPAGKYKVDLSTDIQGAGLKTQTASLNRNKNDYTPYDFLIAPQIASFSSNSGPLQGEDIVITGTGFAKEDQLEVLFEGKPCVVAKSSNTYIKCFVEPLALSETGFREGHAGVIQRTFGAKSSLAELRADTDYKNGGSKGEGKFLTFETLYNAAGSYSESIEGLFEAPVGGNYKFLLSAKGAAELYISETPMTKTSAKSATLKKIASISSGSRFRDFFYPYESSQISDSVTLEAGKRYFLQALHLVSSGDNHLTVGVRIPTTTRNKFSPREVVSVELKAEIERFEAVLTLRKNSEELTIKRLTQTSGTVLKYPATSSDVISALSQVQISASLITRTFKNSAGASVGEAYADRVEYRLKFYTGPTVSPLPQLSKPEYGYFIQAAGNNPTALVQGQFILNVKGTDVTLQFDASEETIENALNAALGITFSAKVSSYGRADEGRTFVIYCNGNPEDIGEITAGDNGLTGGRNGVQITVKTIQDSASSETVLYPIPSDLLRTLETEPQITVRSNGVLAICTGNCKYMPVVDTRCAGWSGFTLNNEVLEVELIRAQSYTSKSNFKGVTFAGIADNCKIDSYNATAQKLTCKLPLNPDGTPQIVAGDHFPTVKVGTSPLCKADGHQVLRIMPTIQDIIAYEISAGYLQFEIKGTGFGLDASCTCKNFGTKVVIGGVPCSLVSLENTMLICEARLAITHGPVELTVNGITITEPFEYEPKTVVRELIDDCYLDLVGTGFVSQTVVQLINQESGDIERCRACIRNSTLIRCATCGLPPGDYVASLTTTLSGGRRWFAQVPFDIDYYVESISPRVGSGLGGTVLTLTGFGFSDTLNKNQVSLGCKDGCKNLRCDVIEASQRELKCRLVANEINLKGTHDVQAILGLEFYAECTDPENCLFTIDDQYTPEITLASSYSLRVGEQITITGTKFTSASQVSFNGVIAPVISNTETQIIVTVPDIASGNVAFNVYDPTIGFYKISEAVKFTAPLVLTQVQPATGSKAGAVITLTGSGFTSSAVAKVGGQTCQIISIKSTEIVCLTPSISTTSAQNVQVTQGTSTNCAACTFTSSDALTPKGTSLTAQFTSGTFNVNLQGTNLAIASPITVKLVSNGIDQDVPVTSSDATSIVAALEAPYPGAYTLEIRVGTNLISFQTATDLNVQIPFPQGAVASVEVSQGGGLDLMLQFEGIKIPQDTSLIDIKLAGFNSQVQLPGTDYIVCTIPALVVPEVPGFGTETLLQGDHIASKPSDLPAVARALDGDTTTSFSGDASCFIGIDVGAEALAEVTRVQFYPKPGMNVARLVGAKLQGYTSSGNWEDFYTVDESVHEGYNTIIVDNYDTQHVYRKLRFIKSGAASNCEIAELRFKGVMYSNLPDASPADLVSLDKAVVTINGVTQEVTIDVKYKSDKTPKVTEIYPRVGTSTGNTEVSIYGTGFGYDSANVEVTIDSAPCSVESVSDEEIICKTGALPPVADRTERLNGIVNVKISGQGAAVNEGVKFLYAERWSDDRTWGCDGRPLEGDSVHVPIGMNLLVDECPPELVAVVVEGGLIFEDMDNEFKCKYLMIRDGLLQIGTEQEPIRSKIIITVSGEREDAQLPIFGNKAIAMYEGVIDIHGCKKESVATRLAKTVLAGATDIEVEDASGIEAGDEIAISSTDIDPDQNEKRTVICKLGNILTLEYPLDFDHLAEAHQQSLDFGRGEQVVEVKAVVALLSRCVVIQGDEVYSQENYYGVHMLFFDPGTSNTVVRMSYTEIRYAGQAGYVERHPINFQNAGIQSNSYIKGCSVHSTYHRGIQLRSTTYLTLTDNVLYQIENEGIYLFDGSERFNTIEGNVIIKVTASLFRYNSYRNPAAIRVANPLNFIRRNIIAGVTRNGFTMSYYSKARGSICPVGDRLGAFENNYVLSAGNVGLFIDTHFPRTQPCGDYRDNGIVPYDYNKPVLASYKSLTCIRARIGAQAWNLGRVEFNNFLIADSTDGAIDIRRTLNTELNLTQVVDSLLIGNLDLKFGEVYLDKIYGILVPGTDGFVVKNVRFADYLCDSPALLGCSDCANPWQDTGSRVTFVQQFAYLRVDKFTAFTAPYTHIFRDLDGTLTQNDGGSVVYRFPHLDGVDGCWENEENFGGLVCSDKREMRGINFWNILPGWQREKTLTIQRLGKDEPSSGLTKTTYRYPGKGYSCPFATGEVFKLYVDISLDLDEWDIEHSPFASPEDLPITFVFNYTEPREDFDITRTVYEPGAEALVSGDVGNSSLPHFDIFNINEMQDKYFGDFQNNVETKEFYFAVTGQSVGNEPVYDSGDAAIAHVKGWRCKNNCPKPFEYVEPLETIDWCNGDGTTWAQQFGPGERVIVPADKAIVLNCNVSVDTLEIQGKLIFPNCDESTPLADCLAEDETVLEAKKIWVRGRFVAGSDVSVPFRKRATIRLVGNRQDEPIVVNYAVDAGTKVIVVTGKLELYGHVVSPNIVRLAENAVAGAMSIKVSESISSAWMVGDEILIGSSTKAGKDSETAFIASIDGNTIYLQSGLKNFHHGNTDYPQTLATISVDTRTEVIRLSSNIKIYGDDNDGLGGRILVTDEYGTYGEETITNTGVIKMYYTSLTNCGQASTDRAGLTFERTTNPQAMSMFVANIIRGSKSYGVRFESANQVYFYQNVILGAAHYGIKFYGGNNNIEIGSNVIAGVTGYPSGPIIDMGDFPAGICIYNKDNTQILITNNIVFGYSFAGYIISDDFLNDFNGNAAHGGKYGLIAYGDQIDNKTPTVKNFLAYRNTYGVISYYRIKRIIVTSSVFIENTVSVNVASSNDGERNVKILSCHFKGVDSTFTQFDSVSCCGQAAIGLNRFTTEIRPDAFGFHRSTRDLVLGSAYEVTSNTFENFEDGVVATCSGSKVFKLSKEATDFIPYITASGNTITRVDRDSLALFLEGMVNDPNCGPETQCTLVDNALIKDLDGRLTGRTKASLIPDNYAPAEYSGLCTKNSKINGYICDDTFYALLGFRNLDDDKRLIVLDPIEIFDQDGLTVNKVNSHRNNNPRHLGDLQKYTAVIPPNNAYTLSFAKDIPMGLEFQLQGELTEYAILKITYYSGRVLRIYNAANGKYIDPCLATPSGAPVIQPATDVCGTYIFNRNEGSIEFLLKADLSNCRLQVQQTNSLVATIRYDISVDEFFEKGGVAPFIDKVAAVLGIPSRRIRVVSIYQGSTIVEFLVDSDYQGVGQRAQAQEELTNLANALQQSVDSGDMSLYDAPVLNFSSSVALVENEDGSVNHSVSETTVITSSNALFYALVIAVPICAVSVAGLVYYRYKKKSKKNRSVVKIAPAVVHQPVAADSQSDVGAIKEARGKKREVPSAPTTDSRNHLATNQGSLDSFGDIDGLNAAKKLALKAKDPKLETIPEKPARRMSIDEKIEDLSARDS